MGKKLEPLFRDATERPEHYGTELMHYIEILRRGGDVAGPIRSQAMVRYSEPTAPAKVKEAVRRASEKVDPSPEDVPVFEEQDAGPSIKIA